VRVGGVLVGSDADIGDLGDPGIRREIAFERLLVLISRIVGTDDDPQSRRHVTGLLSRSA
jgi:hypothetical protein